VYCLLNQPHYDIKTYSRDTTKSGPRFTGPIGLDGLYRKGALTDQGAYNPFFGGPPEVHVVNAVKGTWVNDPPDDHTFVIDWRILGLANSPEEAEATSSLRALFYRLDLGLA
jgi:hypothetical protein